MRNLHYACTDNTTCQCLATHWKPKLCSLKTISQSHAHSDDTSLSLSCRINSTASMVEKCIAASAYCRLHRNSRLAQNSSQPFVLHSCVCHARCQICPRTNSLPGSKILAHHVDTSHLLPHHERLQGQIWLVPLLICTRADQVSVSLLHHLPWLSSLHKVLVQQETPSHLRLGE